MSVMVLVVVSHYLDALIVCRNTNPFVFHKEFLTALRWLVVKECACLAHYLRIAQGTFIEMIS